MSRITRPEVYRLMGKCCPGNGSGHTSCCGYPRIGGYATHESAPSVMWTEGATPGHLPYRQAVTTT